MNYDTIVVGAGVAGLIATRELESAGRKVVLIDKGVSVGGRLATRRIDQGAADHGAQFFTARTDEFKLQVARWLKAEKIIIWGYGWSDGSLKRTASDGHPRYIAVGGMNQLAQAIRAELHTTEVIVNAHVRSVTYGGGIWSAITSDERAFNATQLVVTPPVPQSLELLRGVSLPEDVRAELERIQYGPCLCALFVVDGEVELPEPGAIQRYGEHIYWIADNQRKGISPNERILTLHAQERWSRKYYDAPDEEILAMMQEALTPYLTSSATIRSSQLKKWRYSVPLTTYPRDTILVADKQLAFAGDAFGGRGRVEGAYLSGIAAARALIDL